LAYIFDPIRNTFVDDEDTSLGNKLALNDTSEEIIRQIDEQFGPGTVFPASELPPKENPYKDFEDRNPAANGGMIRQNFAVAGLALPALSYPITLSLAKILGVSTAGAGAAELGNRVTDYLKENPQVFNDPRFKAAALTFGINIPGVIAPDADEMEREAEKIRELTKPTGLPAETEKMPIKTGETTPPEIDTKEEFPADTEQLPTSTGGSEIPEQTLKDFIFYNKKAPVEKKYLSEKEYGERALKKLDPKALNEINNLVKDYRKTKTRTENIYIDPSTGQKKVRGASTQAIMNEQEKSELLQLVVNKYIEKQNKPPSATELKALLPFYSNPSKVARDNNIELSVQTASYDRSDPSVVKQLQETAQSKAIENNTIVVSKNKNFFPENIKLKNGSVVNAEQFFINNLTERTELGPRRPETKERTLSNKQLAELFNTNERNVKRVVANIKNSDDFKADYPEPRKQAFYIKQAADRIKKARKYLTMKELANVKLQEQQLKKLNSMFKDGTLVITDYPNLIKSLNTTIDKETGILDHSIKKTKKDLLKRSKDNSGIFDISHTIGKTTEQQNIEFLRNRNVSDYKTNQALYKSMESYVKNKIDDPEYDLRLEEFDNYIKEMGQRVKIGNRFFGLDEAMINSETGEFTGINRQLEYYGLPKFENGVPLKKVKKADGGSIELSPMPRVDFNGGGAVGANEDFAKELEYFLLNPDAELPKADSYRETMNPVALVNDMIDPRNYAYYGDRLAETGIRIGEFGARVLPALGQLTADLIRKPAFKVTGGTGQGYVQDYTDVMPSNIKGTGIFTEFLDNLVGTEGTKVITEKTGLKSLIESEEQKQKDRRSTIGPKVLADQVTLGAELTAPIFPGLKLLKAYAKNRKLPVNDTTKEIMDKEIDEVLSTQNLTRRDFLKATGASGAVILAKMLGFGDELATTTKVAEKVAKDTVGGTYPPPYFFKLVDKIKFMGDDITERAATQDRQVVKKYKDYEMTEDSATGEIVITKRNEGVFYDQDGILSEEYIVYKPGIADETTKSTPPPEYEEFTVRPDSDGKLKDSEGGLDSIEEILEEVGDPDSLTLKK
jgi:hypothetical protein